MNTELHVVHMVPALFGFEGIVGGAERYALELAKHMADVTRTTLVTFGDRDEKSRIGNLSIRIFGKPWYVRRQKTNPVSMRAFFHLQSADVVHCHQQHILGSSLSAALCRLTKRRVFVSDLGGGGWDISAYLATDRWFNGHLHLSEYSRKIFGHSNKSWAHVILGGVDAKLFSPLRTAAASRLDSPPVLFVGRLLPHKGIADLINAAPVDYPVEVVGQVQESEYFGHLQVLAKGKQVHFRTDCHDDELVRAYQGALCIVLPSVYKNDNQTETSVPELLGQTLLEGMACELPAICTDVASLPEVVVNGVTGFVVPPNNPMALREKINWLRANPAEARKMGRAARQRVLDVFTWPSVVSRCLKAYSPIK